MGRVGSGQLKVTHVQLWATYQQFVACRIHLRTVPAAIIAHLSSDDATVQEGDTVVLVCNVTGVPAPDVTWFRRPASSAPSDRERKLHQ